jgi:xylose isomerase
LELQKGTNVTVLWGTAQLFKDRRYMHGAATSCNASVFAHAAAQVKAAIDTTVLLGGQNYVLWGGREGYSTMLNSDYAHEQKALATFLRMVADYAKKAGLKGHLLLEPKPHEPSKHQYDYDVGTTLAFLRKHGLENEYGLNIECNHATLAGHSCEHEVATASADGAWASFDANTGDPQLGWDTDEFLTDPVEATRVMLALLRQGGWPAASRGGGRSGINFDAKLRRESVSPSDLVLAHVAGIDALARGLRSAAKILEEGRLDALVAERYASWRDKGGLGERILSGKATLVELEKWALADSEKGVASEAEDVRSGRQELAELLVARAIV